MQAETHTSNTPNSIQTQKSGGNRATPWKEEGEERVEKNEERKLKRQIK